MIGLIVKLLDRLVRVYSGSDREASLKVTLRNFPIIEQCFDTLTEMVQGPCHGNQV
jgi:hypothetical protein